MADDFDDQRLVRHRYLSMRTNRLLILISIAVALLGLAIVLWASGWDFKEGAIALGTSILAVGALALAAELTTRRSIVRETLAMADLRQDILTSGLTGLHSSRDAVDRLFPNLVREARKVDLMFISATGWMTTNRSALKRMLDHNGRVRLLIPNPQNDDLLLQLLERFKETTLEGLRRDVSSALDIALALERDHPANGNRGMSVKWLTVVPTYSLFIVDDFGVLRLHEIRKELAEKTPTLVFSKRGDIREFARKDFDEMFDRPAAERAQVQDARP